MTPPPTAKDEQRTRQEIDGQLELAVTFLKTMKVCKRACGIVKC
jgi:hypothetical protein